MLFRTAITLLVMVAIGLLGWRVLTLDGGVYAPELTITAPEGSDYYMRDATIYQMQQNGQLAYRMHINDILHYPDDSARLQDIDGRYEANTETWWSLQAPRGFVPAGSRDIRLEGGVVLRHPKPEGYTVVVRTDYAWVRTQQDIIETTAHATATTPTRMAEGDGLRISLDDDHLKLLDNVHVRYTQ